MAKQYRKPTNEVTVIYGGRSPTGRDTLNPKDVLPNGMTAKQHCEKLIAERGGKGRFIEKNSELEDVCMLHSCSYFGGCYEAAEYSYHYALCTEIEFTATLNGKATTAKELAALQGGERVIITANQDVTWSANDNKKLGKVSINSTTYSFTMPKAGSFTLKATGKCDPKASKSVTVAVKTMTNNQNTLLFAPESMSEIIGEHEGGKNGYDTVNLGEKFGYKSKIIKGLSNMTIDEVIRRQNAFEFNTAGKFQIKRGTLAATKTAMKYSGNEKFSPEIQEKMGEYLFFKRKTGGYIMGTHTDRTSAGDDLAREWASLPVLSPTLKTGIYTVKRGQSAYDSGFNRSHHTPESVEIALDNMRNTYQQAIRAGMSEHDAKQYSFRGIKSKSK
ncbi:hypothetical protein [Wielerella bovis]|uniref:hypothetical protein n=1 Tax=Wielerella bovis TaxID=2917790 RepID=UPI0020197D65|nr:hypothetical protein [Wielerella bovis]ULJ59875.1 hypothetical protein MIS44_09390 [Wielerella bovis]